MSSCVPSVSCRGVLPFTERKQSIMQSHDKIRQFKYHHSSSNQSQVTQGSRVCLRSSPVYSAGGKGIHMKGTQLQCGVLQSSVISPTLSEKCSFKVISATEGCALGVEVEEEGMDQQTAEVDTVKIGTVTRAIGTMGKISAGEKEGGGGGGGIDWTSAGGGGGGGLG